MFILMLNLKLILINVYTHTIIFYDYYLILYKVTINRTVVPVRVIKERNDYMYIYTLVAIIHSFISYEII